MDAPDGACILEKGDGGKHVPLWRRKCVQLLVCLAALLVIVIILIVILISVLLPGFAALTAYKATGTHLPSTEDSPASAPVPAIDEFTLGDGRPITRRSQWTSLQPGFRRPLPHPTPYVVIGHTGGPACTDIPQCYNLLSAYRYIHETSWEQPDIMFNFFIDVNGNVYEGCGWDTTNIHESWVSRCNLAVALLGNFVDEDVTTEMMDSLRQLLDLGVELGKLDPQYRLVAQNQLMSTLSPGTNALRAISTWPNRCLDHCDEGVQCGARDTDGLDA
uniref:PGRP-SA n=1 Tax=Locusta migratoria TaxID=7004 RepID=A0A1J0M093_LOCMI|nr:PGRP-SA [Locusta migratoria]